MSKIEGGLGQCFDKVRENITGFGVRVVYADEAERALDDIEEAFERRARWVHDANGMTQRFVGMVEAEIVWLRSLWDDKNSIDPMELKRRGDELETRLLEEHGNRSLDRMAPKALVELGVAVAAALERRGITAFPVQLGGDGKIQGPGAPEEG